MTSQTFLRGAFILAAAGFTSKLMGALYRIPLARMIGGEGIGLFQMAYPIYTIILAVSTAGIPVAISILVSEKNAQNDYYGALRIFKITILLLAAAGVLLTTLVYTYSYWLAANILNDERAFYAIAAISPALFFAAVNSTLRGFFQGHQNMVPTAVSQVSEQLVRVTTVLIAAYLLLPYGIEFSAAGAIFGTVTGAMFSTVVLLTFYFTLPKIPAPKSADYNKEKVLTVIKRIAYIAVPISVGGLIMPLMQLIDAAIVPMRLQAAGIEISRATDLFGQLAGMANVLVNLPAIVTISLAISLVPVISELATKNQWDLMENRLASALRVAFLISIPSAFGLWVLAEPISEMLFGVPEAGIPLSFLAPAVIFIGFYKATGAVLQGVSKTYLPVKNLLIGAAVKVILNYWLTAVPVFGIRGAALATVVGFAIASVLNYNDIKKVTGQKIRWLSLSWKPLLSAVVMAAAVYCAYIFLVGILGNTLAVIAAIFLGVVVYTSAAFVTGAVRKRDLEMVPYIGEKMAKIAVKLRLVK